MNIWRLKQVKIIIVHEIFANEITLSLFVQVGAVDIDSGWSTGYNNFIFNTNKYPNATEMVGQ